MAELSNGLASLSLESSPLRLNVAFVDSAAPQVRGGQFSIRWLDRGEVNLWNGNLYELEMQGPLVTESEHGNLNVYKIRGLTEDGNLEIGWEFALPRRRPLVLWRASVTARPSRIFELLDIDLLRVGPMPPPGPVGLLRAINPFAKDVAAGQLELSSEDPELAWLSDGWQSWSFSGVVSEAGTLTGTRLGPLTRPLYINQGGRRLPGPDWYGSDFFGVLADRSARSGILVGQLSERQAFGSLEARLDPRGPAVRLYSNGDCASLESGRKFTTDWAVMQPVDLDEPDPLGPYINAVARENEARAKDASEVGWSSWYYYFDNVTRSDTEANLSWLRQRVETFPVQYVQIDDGHQRAVGDWDRPGEGFRDRAELAERIREAGFKPGLWLAPFAAHPESQLVEQHPDWLLRGKGGRPVRAGYNWGSFFVGLDLTHPEVQDYIRRTIRLAVQEWGFRYLKLDFLYTGALPGRRHNPGRTRAQGLRRALEIIREAAGRDVHLVGCGCPLGPAVGIFDSMRVGPDVAARWVPAYQGIEFFFQREPSLPSARNSIQNTLSRAGLHGRWWINDPDCLLVRSRDSHLDEHEIETLATVAAMSGGALAISDALPELDPDRVEMFARLLPPIGKAAHVVDW
ncbi:MAG: glycoside hydrolase family 36 protein, partial [Anaerolineales bacterium]|nr:glycoside hydrolase family 36 protein [Anaerolineales bacterium]